MGPDTEEGLKAIRKDVDAATEAVRLMREELERAKAALEARVKKVADNCDKREQARRRAVAAYTSTYEANTKEGK